MVVMMFGRGGQGALVLSNALCANSTLLHLNLDGNPIGSGGARSMARAMNNAQIPQGGAQRIISMNGCSFDLLSSERKKGNHLAPISKSRENIFNAHLLTLCVLTECFAGWLLGCFAGWLFGCFHIYENLLQL